MHGWFRGRMTGWFVATVPSVRRWILPPTRKRANLFSLERNGDKRAIFELLATPFCFSRDSNSQRMLNFEGVQETDRP